MNWALDINTLMQIGTVATIAGMGWQSLKQLRRDLDKLEREVIDFREIKADLAVVRTQLTSMSASIEKMVEKHV